MATTVYTCIDAVLEEPVSSLVTPVRGASGTLDSLSYARALGVPTRIYSRHGINKRSSLCLNLMITFGISAEDGGGGELGI